MSIQLYKTGTRLQRIPESFGESIYDDDVHRQVCSDALQWTNQHDYLIVSIAVVSSSAVGNEKQRKVKTAKTQAFVYYDSNKPSKGHLRYSIETYRYRSTENSIQTKLKDINKWTDDSFAFVSVDNWEQLEWEFFTKKVPYRKTKQMSWRLATTEMSTVMVFYYDNQVNSWRLPIYPVTNTHVKGWRRNWSETACPEPQARDDMCNIQAIDNDGKYEKQKNCENANGETRIVIHDSKDEKISNLKSRKRFNPLGKYVFRRPLFKCYQYDFPEYDVKVKSKSWVFASYQSCVDEACSMATTLVHEGYNIISIQLQTSMHLRTSIMVFYYGPFPSLMTYEHKSKIVVAEYSSGSFWRNPAPAHTAYSDNIISISTDVYIDGGFIANGRDVLHVTSFWLIPDVNSRTPIYFTECDANGTEPDMDLPPICRGQLTKYMSAITLACICEHDLVVLPSGHPESISALKRWFHNSNVNPYTNTVLSKGFVDQVMSMETICPRGELEMEYN